MTEKCSIHYHACECREAKFARVIEAAKCIIADYDNGCFLAPAIRQLETELERLGANK